MEEINRTTWKHIAQDNPKDFLEVEIGDAKQERFFPQMKVKRWQNECNFSIRLQEAETGKESVKREGEKIIWNKGNLELDFYEIEDAFKFDYIIKKKPATNKLTFTLQSKDVKFYYQPELTQKEKDEGAVRPENVVGSYAVYSETKGGMNRADGKEYKCGKVGHIYRPKLIDAEGKETWGNLHIENGIYSVEIPQDFLDKAVYPIKSNDTFGYTTAGGTGTSIASESSGHSNRVGASYNTEIIKTGSEWTIPAGVTSIIVECWGGGAAGGGRTGSNGNGGGGGGGAYSRKAFTGLTPGNKIAYTIGAEATGGTGDGANGNKTWFSSDDSSGCVAVGGTGGTSGTPGSGGAGGAAASGHGDTKYSGGAGSNGSGTTTASGAGGSGAGSIGNGNNASGTTAGATKLELGGAGGPGRTSGGAGSQGLVYGGGGGGALRNSTTNRNGGRGRVGVIRITWAAGATAPLDSISAHLSGDSATDVKVYLNKTHGVSYSIHNEIAKKENLACAAAAGWKTFTTNNEDLVATDAYVLSAVGKVGTGVYFLSADTSDWGSFTNTNVTYATEEGNLTAELGAALQTFKFSIYATYTPAVEGTNITIDGQEVKSITIDGVPVTGVTIDGVKVF